MLSMLSRPSLAQQPTRTLIILLITPVWYGMVWYGMVHFTHILSTRIVVALVYFGDLKFVIACSVLMTTSMTCFTNIMVVDYKFGDFGQAVIGGLWAYDGWNSLNKVTGECMCVCMHVCDEVAIDLQKLFCFILEILQPYHTIPYHRGACESIAQYPTRPGHLNGPLGQ